MHINVTGRHLDITEAIRDYCVDKVQHALADAPRVSNVHVVLAVEKHLQRAEVVLQVFHHAVEASDSSENLYAAIDGVADKVARQVAKLRGKVTDHKDREKLGEVEARTQRSAPPADEA